MNLITAGRVWVSPPPLSVPTTHPAKSQKQSQRRLYEPPKMLQKYIQISLYATSVFLNHKTNFNTSVKMSRLRNYGEYMVLSLKKQLQFSQQQNLFTKQIRWFGSSKWLICVELTRELNFCNKVNARWNVIPTLATFEELIDRNNNEKKVKSVSSRKSLYDMKLRNHFSNLVS